MSQSLHARKTRHQLSPVPLPPRYDRYWQDAFDSTVRAHLTDGVRVLDVGSGRAPTIKPHLRPSDCEYVGLDVSADELRAAGAGAYDAYVVGSITREVPELRGSFDLAVSWQVLEHVRPLALAAANMRSYLREGGTVVSLLSGTFAIYALLNRILPDPVGHALVSRTMCRSRDTAPVFPAHYDSCYAAALRRTFAQFQTVSVTPFYCAARYFAFARPLLRAYLVYENFICRRGYENLATHYLLVAKR